MTTAAYFPKMALTAWPSTGMASGGGDCAWASSAHAPRIHAPTLPSTPLPLPARASSRRRCGGGGGATSIADCSRRRAVELPEAVFHTTSVAAPPAVAFAGGGAVPGASARKRPGLQLNLVEWMLGGRMHDASLLQARHAGS